ERHQTHVEQARADLELLREDVTGAVRLGAIPTTVHALLPPALALLRDRHPALAVTLEEGEAEQTLPRVVDGSLDVAVLESWEHRPVALPPTTSRTTLLHDVADLVLPSSHRLAHRKVVDLAEVDDIGWIGWSTGSGCLDWLTHVLRRHGVDARITCTIGNYPTQLALVAGNVGAAVVPRLGRDSVPDGVRVVATRPALNRTIHVVTRSEDDDRGSIRACVDALTAASEPFQSLV
ncbi:LysR substrate-binding domain-containing protein, partial [Actinosynnema sp. NPDC023658]|uniref:LysR substrate-binding domain-containing protein n=1 Tax=Actinosynnema sp. NPDC023658 TaxID=3155465 RepID=UPI0033C8A8CD